MSTLVTGGTVVLVRFGSFGCRTDTYANLEDALAKLLMYSGDKIPFLVRDKLLPPAIAAWEKSIKQDACDHEFDNGFCSKCESSLDE